MSILNNFSKWTAKPTLSYGSLTLLLCLTMSCTNAEGRLQIAWFPSAVLDSQAKNAYQDQLGESPLSTNKNLTEINRRVGQRLIAIAKRDYAEFCEGFEWEVTLFDQPDTVNAYCMPGGKIGIYTGILEVCENEAALAAVMGHEIAHALLEHGNERMSGQVLISGFLLGLGIQLESNESLNKKARDQIVGMAGMAGEVGLALPFSRSHESEADKLGLRLLARAGYEPSEAANLWRRMKEKSGGSPPEILSTHPSHDTRIEDLENLVSEVADDYKNAKTKYGLGVSLIKDAP